MFGMARSILTRLLIFCVRAVVLTTMRPTSVASPDAVKLRSLDGGQNYYGQFANGLPADPRYFPARGQV